MTFRAAWALRLYPRHWRDRYGAELAELTEELVAAEETSASRAALDLVLFAAIARCRVIRRRLAAIPDEASAANAVRDHKGARVSRTLLAAACGGLVAFSIIVGLAYSHEESRAHQLSTQLVAARQDEARANALVAKEASTTHVTLACTKLPLPPVVVVPSTPGNGPVKTMILVPAPPGYVSSQPINFAVSSAAPVTVQSGATVSWSSANPCT